MYILVHVYSVPQPHTDHQGYARAQPENTRREEHAIDGRVAIAQKQLVEEPQEETKVPATQSKQVISFSHTHRT